MCHKKKLLVLTPRYPYPVIGGDRLRIYQVCKSLSNKFSLTLLSLCESEAEMSMPPPTDGVFDRVEKVLLGRSHSYLNTLLALPGSIPLQVAYYHSAHFSRAVNRLLPSHDGVLSHLIRCAEYLKDAKIPRFLEMTDAISLNYERVRQMKRAGGFKGHIYRIEARRLLAYERKVLDEFDLSVLVSNTDKVHLVDATHEKVIVCSNGVALDQLPFKNRMGSKPVIVYIGNMFSMQNMDACLYFAEEVMPVLNRRVKATFRVVGQISARDAGKLLKFANVEVTGPVENIATAVDDARIGVCPVRMGAGVQNKVLEYMALGLPVVTSSIGLEGINAQPGRDLLVADTPEGYADSIFQLWNNQALMEQFSLNGHAYVSANHDWNHLLAPLVERIGALLYRT